MQSECYERAGGDQRKNIIEKAKNPVNWKLNQLGCTFHQQQNMKYAKFMQGRKVDMYINIK